MPIAFPPIDRGPDYAPVDANRKRAPDYDLTNLGMIGAALTPDSLAPGFPQDFSTSRAVNLRNLDTQFNGSNINTMAPEPNIGTPNDRGVYSQTDWAQSNRAITGVSRDSTGTILGLCRVELFITGGNYWVAETTSDASGNFSFGNPGTGPFFIVAYKAGSPDVAGTTVNTLMPLPV